MFDDSHFNRLSDRLPLPVYVNWNSKPSRKKYGHVNALLATVDAFLQRGAKLRDVQGSDLAQLTIEYSSRKITDRKRRHFHIVGHLSARPLLLLEFEAITFELYFNFHLFLEAKTTFTQYYPSATVIVRPSNYLATEIVRSPGSWGSDIIWMKIDWLGTLILESSPDPLTGLVRKNFRGFKLVTSSFKEFLIGRALNQRERLFLANNGFLSPIVIQNDDILPVLQCSIRQYIDEQLNRQQEMNVANTTVNRT